MVKKISIGSFFVLVSLFLIACGGQEEETVEFEVQEELVEIPNIQEEQEQPVSEVVSEAELIGEDTAVLIVNDEVIYGDHYNLVYYETKISLMQNDELSEDLNQVHEEAMDALIRQTLFTQDAYEKGIVITDSEAEAIFQDTKAQFETEEEFYQVLDQLPYTEAVFREILEKSLLQQYYIDQEFTDISVSANDIEDFYAILEEQMDEAPPLADIRTEIENQLYHTELQLALNDRINQLMADAEIEEL